MYTEIWNQCWKLSTVFHQFSAFFWGSSHRVLLYTKVKSEEKFVYRKVKASLQFVYEGQIKVLICIHFVYNCKHFFSDKGRILYTVEIFLGDIKVEIIEYSKALTVRFFQIRLLSVPLKSRNTTVLGQVGWTSTQ